MVIVMVYKCYRCLCLCYEQSADNMAAPTQKPKNDVKKEKDATSAEEKMMNRTFYIIFISLVIDLLAFTVILPLLPSLLDHYGNSDTVS